MTYKIKQSDQKFANLLLIDLVKNDQKLSLVFDTGASLTVLSQSAGRLLGAKAKEETIQAGGTAGNLLMGNLYQLEDFYVGDYLVDYLDAVLVEDQTLDFGFDEEGKPLKCHGFIGWNFISDFRWLYDHHKRVFYFEKDQVGHGNGLLLDWDNMPLVCTKSDGNDQVYGFDSGHTESVLGRLGYQQRQGDNLVLETIVGLDGERQEEVLMVEELDLMVGPVGVKLKNISALDRDLFPSSQEGVLGLLGMDLLEGRSWILDYPKRHFEIIK